MEPTEQKNCRATINLRHGRYSTVCECGWRGPIRRRSAEATEDAIDHSKHRSGDES
jgi:hypothetical protein